MTQSDMRAAASFLLSSDQTDKGPSEFVYFISELQKHIPVEIRRHMPAQNAKDQTIYMDALSQAIYRARRSHPRRDVVAFEELRKYFLRSAKHNRKPAK
jgi:hypothetical protein